MNLFSLQYQWQAATAGSLTMICRQFLMKPEVYKKAIKKQSVADYGPLIALVAVKFRSCFRPFGQIAGGFRHGAAS